MKTNWDVGNVAIVVGLAGFGRTVEITEVSRDGDILTGRFLSPETSKQVTKDLQAAGLEVDYDKSTLRGPAKYFMEATPANIQQAREKLLQRERTTEHQDISSR